MPTIEARDTVLSLHDGQGWRHIITPWGAYTEGTISRRPWPEFARWLARGASPRSRVGARRYSRKAARLRKGRR